MEDSKKEMDEITKALNQIAIDATPNRRRSKRVRHLKAIKIVQSNKENQNQNRSRKEEKQEEKEESKLNPILETRQTINMDCNKNDIIFPLFDTIKYKLIIDKYDIYIPLYLNKWLHKLLRMINNCDIETEIDAYSWIVLLYPSLILIENSKQPTCIDLHKLVTKTIKKLCDCMYGEAFKTSELSLNDSLICIELFENKKDLYSNINKLMETTNTFNKFLKLSCSRSKDIKSVQELLNCSSTQIIHKKTMYTKIRSKWESFIGVYTQIVRLHRLYKLDIDKKKNNLTRLCKENIMKICNIFDNNYCNILKDLLLPLKQKTDCIKMDYSYYRYKTMAMCTHTPTSIVPTFAAYFGYIDEKNKNKKNNIDMTLWMVIIDALQDDVNKFIKTTNDILLVLKEKEKKVKKHKQINKMSKKSTHFLRILDNICYQSVCAMIMYESYDGNEKKIEKYFNKLIKIRKDMSNILHKLADNSLLFCDIITGLNDDILHSCFLTYDKEQKQVWSVHLMSGILLNYWIPK